MAEPPAAAPDDLPGVTASCIAVIAEEDARLEETLARYLEALGRLPYPVELILVNNGAGPGLSDRLAAATRGARLPVKVLSLGLDAGESSALSLAFQEASGDILAILPPYLQIDPADIAASIEPVRRGKLDYVASWRLPRVDPRGAVRKSQIFNRLTTWLTGVALHDINSGLRVLRRQVTQHVAIYGDLHRFLPILAAQQGFRVGEVKVRHIEERVKAGDYRMGVYLRRLLDLLTLFFLIKFTRKPLRFFGLIGSAVLALGLVALAVLCVERMLGVAVGDRPLLVFSVLLIVLGAQSFSMGLLGELIIYFFHARDISKTHVERVYDRDASRAREVNEVAK
ncbi:MAG TPA: glycosyltransferase [Planctomycetota bacterium]|nr:glycosyltransferase [Planctomycetota bacterium]